LVASPLDILLDPVLHKVFGISILYLIEPSNVVAVVVGWSRLGRTIGASSLMKYKLGLCCDRTRLEGTLSLVARSLFGDFGQEHVATRNRPGWRTQSLFRINRRYVRVYRKNNDGAKSKKKGDS